MPQKKEVEEMPKTQTWNPIRKRIPSGKKLEWGPDSDCLLRFVGYREILLPDTGETVTYLSFWDGKQIVTCHESYAFSQAGKLTEGSFYYLHNNGEIDTKVGTMNDLEINELGIAGTRINGIPEPYASRLTPPEEGQERDPEAVLVVSDDTARRLNYSHLNYCFRK